MAQVKGLTKRRKADQKKLTRNIQSLQSMLHGPLNASWELERERETHTRDRDRGREKGVRCMYNCQ